MSIFIDNREHSLIDILKTIDVTHCVKALDLADIEITGKMGQRFLLERKTLPDLAASLTDGRFKSQKDRLLGVLQREPATTVAYVFEGILGNDNTTKIGRSRITVGAIRSLLNTIQLKYRIPVITTRNLQGTSLLIKSIQDKLISKPDFMPVNGGSNEGCAGHADLLPKLSKNIKNDAGSIWIASLTALKGVSSNIATTIVKYFDEYIPLNGTHSTISDQSFMNMKGTGKIIWYARNNTYDEFKTHLCKIKTNNRSLSKKVIDNVLNMFYPSLSISPLESNNTIITTSSKSHESKIPHIDSISEHKPPALSKNYRKTSNQEYMFIDD